MCDIGSDPSMHDAPTCDGNRQGLWRMGEYGFTGIPCKATRGLVSFTDAAGRTRRYCPAHRADVERRFGVAAMAVAR